MATNRVDKILVTNGTDRATVAALTAGDYIVLVDGKSANAVVTDKDSFRVAVMKQNGEVKYSDTIKAKDIVTVTKEAYSPVVEQSVQVTMGTPVADREYALTIVDKSDKELLQMRQDKRTYQVTASVTETASSLAGKFKDFINADEASPVVATIGEAGLSSITVDTPGSGYSSAPTVSITGGGGSGATATATIDAGEVVSINITNAGSGYTSAPTVTLTGGGGTGATATATVGAGNDSLILTAKAKSVVPNMAGQYGIQHYFSVALRTENSAGHYLPFGNIVTIQNPGFGNGTIPHVRAFEQWSAGYDGILNRIHWPIPQVQYDSIIGKTYDIYSIVYNNKYWSNSVAVGEVMDPVTLVLAVEAGQGADLEATLTNFM